MDILFLLDTRHVTFTAKHLPHKLTWVYQYILVIIIDITIILWLCPSTIMIIIKQYGLL